MNFSLKFLLFVLLTFYVTVSKPDEHLNCTAPNTHDECPENAICSEVNETTKNFQCTCLPNYVRNPLWQQVISGNNANANTTDNNNNTTTTNNNNNNNNKNNSVNNTSNNNNNNTDSNKFNILNSTNGSAYCLTNATQTANGKVYVRQPAKIEHLVFGILMVLFVAVAAISLLYLLKVLRPIKRSRAVYTQLRRRRENRERLEEYRDDDISMIELTEKR